MITRRNLLLGGAGAIALSACMRTAPAFGPDGQPLPVLYWINPDDTARIQTRMLDGVNAMRANAGASTLRLDTALNVASASHARDMALQNRSWHFGSDRSSPIDRALRAGYFGTVLGENLSESYESELETIAAWMMRVDTRDVLTDPRGRDMGVAFHQEQTGKIWWTLMIGDGGGTGLDVVTRR